MSFIDPFNSWSLVHFAGSLLLTLTLGSLNIHMTPFFSGGLVFGSGMGWELVADGRFRNDPRGGDYYDLMWDLGGVALGTTLVQSTSKYRRTHNLSHSDLQFHPLIPSSVSGSNWPGWYASRRTRLNLPPSSFLNTDSTAKTLTEVVHLSP
jgi:hypothetical protein